MPDIQLIYIFTPVIQIMEKGFRIQKLFSKGVKLLLTIRLKSQIHFQYTGADVETNLPAEVRRA